MELGYYKQPIMYIPKAEHIYVLNKCSTTLHDQWNTTGDLHIDWWYYPEEIVDLGNTDRILELIKTMLPSYIHTSRTTYNKFEYVIYMENFIDVESDHHRSAKFVIFINDDVLKGMGNYDREIPNV